MALALGDQHVRVEVLQRVERVARPRDRFAGIHVDDATSETDCSVFSVFA